MKKMLHGILLIALFFSFAVCVHADLLATPHENDFFMDHLEEINGYGWYHQAQKKVYIYENPLSEQVVGIIEEGDVVIVHYLYEDVQGNLWGVQVISDKVCAWFEMKDMSDFYWYYAFQLDHEKEFKETYDEQIYIEEDGWLIMWEYPGSNRVRRTLPTSDTRNKQYPAYAGWEYMDEQGVRWVSFGYKGKYGWLNMEHPWSYIKPVIQSEYITLDENFHLEDDSDLDTKPARCEKELMIGTLVMSVCVLTGVLFALKKKRK